MCSVLSPERVADLKECAAFLGGQKADADIDDSLPMRLLADIKALWLPGEQQMFTRDLLDGLRCLEDSPWAAEIPLTSRKLARMLRPLGIESATVRSGTETSKGYKWDAFESAFSRYLSAETSHASQPA